MDRAEQTFCCSEDVFFSELGDGTGALLHLHSKVYFTLNPTARTVWNKLVACGESGASISALAKTLSQRFRVDTQQAVDDVRSLLQVLLDEELVVWIRGR